MTTKSDLDLDMAIEFLTRMHINTTNYALFCENRVAQEALERVASDIHAVLLNLADARRSALKEESKG